MADFRRRTAVDASTGGEHSGDVSRSRPRSRPTEPVIHQGAEADELVRSADARAVTWGRHIAFATGEYHPGTPEGDALIAHELAHVAQQEAFAEQSDWVSPRGLRVATDAGLEGSAGSVLGRSTGLALARCSRSDPIQEALDGRTPWTTPLAERAIGRYAGLSDADKQRLVDRYGATQVQPMLAALPPGSTGPGGAYQLAVQELLQRIQRTAARSDAASQGLPNEAAMAQAQANEMTARNTAAAAAALPPLSPPPTTAQVAAQQAQQVASTSIPAQTATMTAARESTINTTLTGTSIPAFVAWSTAHHPTLHITAAHFRADARAVFDRGTNVVAFADGGAIRAVVGEAFVSAVALDPAYALPTVVHELWGHGTYGPYGDPGSEYGLELYDRSAALMPGYTAPAAGTQARTSELDAYAYQETEMYSLMREIAYFTPNAPAHAAAMANINYDPAPAIHDRIRTIHDQWEARLARALLHGLFRRFLADPTVTPRAMSVFNAGVRAVFSAADAAAIIS
jgi:hypothetical protein